MPGPYTFSVGDFICSVVADGVAEYPVDGLLERLDGSPGLMKDALNRLHPEGTYPTAMNALLFQTPDGVVLVDTGNGPRGEPATGEVARRVAEALAAGEELLTLIYHFPFPGLGRVRREGGGFAWEAAVEL